MSFFCLVIIKLNDIQHFVQRRKMKKREDNNTFTYTYKKKKWYLYYADRRIFFYLHRAFHSILWTQFSTTGRKIPGQYVYTSYFTRKETGKEETKWDRNERKKM